MGEVFQMAENVCCIVNIRSHRDTADHDSRPPSPRDSVAHPCDSELEQSSCSGILLDSRQGLVLCPISAFIPFLTDLDSENAQKKGYMQARDLCELEISVTLGKSGANKKGRLLQTRVTGHRALSPKPPNLKPTYKQLHTANIVTMFPCKEFMEIMSHLLPQSEKWKFIDNIDHLGSTPETEWQVSKKQMQAAGLLGWFALLSLDDWSSHGFDSQLTYILARDLYKGQAVLTCGSPFGSFFPDVFLNSLSKGIVSGLAGSNNELMTTDARCMVGTEGGAVFVEAPPSPDAPGGHQLLAGIIVVPLFWKSGEFVGLTLVCSFSSILNSLRQTLERISGDFSRSIGGLRSVRMQPCMGILDSCPTGTLGGLSNVVLIEQNATWGSGVMVEPAHGLVVTCRHVVQGAPNGKVKVMIRADTCEESFTWLDGTVLFATSLDSPYDLSVVKLSQSCLHIPHVEISQHYTAGEDVLVAGFALFGKRAGPTLTSGVMSSVVTLLDGRLRATELAPPRLPGAAAECRAGGPAGGVVMLHTSCAVHAGASGGAVMRSGSGELLGIVSSNARDNVTGASHPHINFSVPAALLQPCLEAYRRTQDPAAFSLLNNTSLDLKAVWGLKNIRRLAKLPTSKL
ncbi:peroxisomal leader peptide-processing protease [Lampetra fluviatilis]